VSGEGLVAALARAQAAFGAIDKAKRAEAGKYGYSYADIADVLAEVRPKLNAEGIAVLQPIRVTEHGMVLVTQLRKGDEVLESEMLLPIEGQAPQQVGSLCTYYRRYALCSLVGVAPENEDDDGAAAQETVSHRTSSRPVASGGKPASEAQVNFARRLLDEVIPPTMHLNVIGEHARDLTSVDDLGTLQSHEISPLIEWLKLEKKNGRTATGDLDGYTEAETEPF
jgi:hypothetical protein